MQTQQCEILITNHLQRNGFCHAVLSFFLPSFRAERDSCRTRHHRRNSLSLRMSHMRERFYLVYFSNCWWRNFLLLKGILCTDLFYKNTSFLSAFTLIDQLFWVRCKITTHTHKTPMNTKCMCINHLHQKTSHLDYKENLTQNLCNT